MGAFLYSQHVISGLGGRATVSGISDLSLCFNLKISLFLTRETLSVFVRVG